MSHEEDIISFILDVNLVNWMPKHLFIYSRKYLFDFVGSFIWTCHPRSPEHLYFFDRAEAEEVGFGPVALRVPSEGAVFNSSVRGLVSTFVVLGIRTPCSFNCSLGSSDV